MSELIEAAEILLSYVEVPDDRPHLRLVAGDALTRLADAVYALKELA